MLIRFYSILYSLQQSKIKNEMAESFCDVLKLCPDLKELELVTTIIINSYCLLILMCFNTCTVFHPVESSIVPFKQ